jgi:hypothetical protein
VVIANPWLSTTFLTISKCSPLFPHRANNLSRDDRSCLHLGNHPSEALQGYAKKHESENRNYKAVTPDNIEPRTTIKDSLGETDKMGRR